jgi:hypothetical protein
MATTTNYGWTTPDDTALVKDGAAAIRTLGSSIDTTTKNLNPSTTLGDIEYRSSTANVNTRLPLGTAGQVLKVNSGATAPEWATDASGMTNPMTTTGDTIYSSSGSTPARLAIGSTGNVLTVAGGVPTWAAPAGGGKVLQVVAANTTTETSNSTTSFADTTLTATITPTSASSKILVLVNQNGLLRSATSQENALSINLMRGASNISQITHVSLFTGTSLLLTVPSAVAHYLDSPATTSATTYKTQFANRQPSAEVIVQHASNMSSIVLLEIGA